MKEYIKHWAKFNKLGKRISVSDLGLTASTSRTMLFEKIYEKLALNFNSMILLAQKSSTEEFDVSLIATAARNIMETTNLFYYFDKAVSNKEKFAFQERLLSLSNYKYTNNLLTKLNISRAGTIQELYQLGYYLCKRSIETNPYFMSLPTQDQQYLLSGAKHMYKQDGPGLLEKNVESAVYNMFSNSIHCLYAGLSSNSLNPSPYPTAVDPVLLCAFSFEVSGFYYANVILRYLSRRPTLRREYSPNELEFLTRCATNSLMYWLDYFRAQKSKLSFE